MSRQDASTRILPWLLSIVLGVPALCALALSATRPHEAAWGLGIALTVVWAMSLAVSRWLGARAAPALLALCSFGLLLWPEMALRLTSFHFDHSAVIQFGHPRPDKLILAPRDPELFWRLPPGDGTNSLGFRGPEFQIPKPAGTRRVLFFGDSCMQQGIPRVVANRMKRDGPAIDAINLGVSGYTSHQGLVLAKRWIEPLEADAAVIFFGWNDHWLAYGASDSERAASRTQPTLTRLLEGSRTLQWLVSRSPVAKSEPLDTPRVSLKEYRDNVTAIGDLTAARGGTVVLVTAPSAHERLGVPDYLIDKGFALDADKAVVWHRAYNAEIRRIATRRRWPIADLQVETQQREDLAALFMADGIHFTAPGLKWVGDRISEKLSGGP